MRGGSSRRAAPGGPRELSLAAHRIAAALERIAAAQEMMGGWPPPRPGYVDLPRGPIYLGTTVETGEPVGLELQDMPSNLLVSGAQGSGTSMAAMGIAERVVRRGVPVLVFDPGGDWRDRLLSSKLGGRMRVGRLR